MWFNLSETGQLVDVVPSAFVEYPHRYFCGLEAKACVIWMRQSRNHFRAQALYLDELSDEAIEVLAAHLPLTSSPMSDTPIFPLTGAYRSVPDGATAFGGSRKGGWLVNMAAAADCS